MTMSSDIVSSENTCLSVSMHLIILICKQFVTQKLQGFRFSSSHI